MNLNQISQSVLDVLRNERFLSPDPTTKIGAVLVEGDRILSKGHNCPFEEIKDLALDGISHEKLFNRNYKINVMEHAECNCLRRNMYTMYHSNMLLITSTPCLHCAMEIVKHKVKHVGVVGFEPDFNDEKWGSLWKDALEYLSDNEVEIIFYDSEGKIVRRIEEGSIIAG